VALLFRNPGTTMEVSGLISPLVVTLRGAKDPLCTLNKNGDGLYIWYGGLGEKQDILFLLRIEPRFLVRSVSVLVNYHLVISVPVK